MERDIKILVVDSEENFIETTQDALEPDFEVVLATSAKEGMDKAVKECPEVIILGYLEPRGTSFRLHKELRNDASTKSIPLLVVDVRPEEHSRKGWKRQEGLHMYADDYMARPVEPEELRTAIDGILRRASMEPMGLKEASEQMERALARINKIEELLIK
jgi:DNA-binding response OmpR family regulator